MERPTSITNDSELSRTRARLESHASRSMVLEDTGSENSISAAGEPASASRVSSELVT
ncbi:MAG: hypothetical protein ACYDAL_09780 [Candidatus Dormibacteraceae bacterium]